MHYVTNLFNKFRMIPNLLFCVLYANYRNNKYVITQKILGTFLECVEIHFTP